ARGAMPVARPPHSAARRSVPPRRRRGPPPASAARRSTDTPGGARVAGVPGSGPGERNAARLGEFCDLEFDGEQALVEDRRLQAQGLDDSLRVRVAHAAREFLQFVELAAQFVAHGASVDMVVMGKPIVAAAARWAAKKKTRSRRVF